MNMHIVKKVRFIEVPEGVTLSESLSDGIYAQIRYRSDTVGLANKPNPFPWEVTVFAFESGEAREISDATSPADTILVYGVTGVIAVGLSPERRAELEKKLSRRGITIIPS